MSNDNYKIPVVTERFIYHVSYQVYRESIEINGLKANSKPNTIGYENAVFAHNYGKIDVEWYPLTMDKYDWNFNYDDEDCPFTLDTTEVILRRFEDYYDVWQIDTEKLARQWFRDDVAEREFDKSLFSPEHLYVMTFGDIPRDCIERARIKVIFATTKFDWGILNIRRLKLVA